MSPKFLRGVVLPYRSEQYVMLFDLNWKKWIVDLAQVNFNGLKIFSANFLLILKLIIWRAASICVKYWGKVAPGRARVGDPGWVRSEDAKFVR